MLKPDEFRLSLRLTCQNFIDAWDADDGDNQDAALTVLCMLLDQNVGSRRPKPTEPTEAAPTEGPTFEPTRGE